MCNLSTGFYNEGRERGFSEGRTSGFNEGKATGFSEGKEIGARETIYQSIQMIKESLHVSDEKAMDILKVPQDERSYYVIRN